MTSKSPNFDARPSGVEIDMLVIHYTGMKDAASALDRLCDPGAKVSAHYLIDENGFVACLVDEKMRAWHAGAAYWRGRRDVNARSVGVELVNPGHEFGYRSFPEVQIKALEGLVLEILSRHAIESQNVVGHGDVAPCRKEDPGELFDWQRLAGAGIGLWPEKPESAQVGDVAVLLAEYGYDTENLEMAVRAFQRHFRPQRVDGIADREIAGLLTALVNGLP